MLCSKCLRVQSRWFHECKAAGPTAPQIDYGSLISRECPSCHDSTSALALHCAPRHHLYFKAGILQIAPLLLLPAALSIVLKHVPSDFVVFLCISVILTLYLAVPLRNQNTRVAVISSLLWLLPLLALTAVLEYDATISEVLIPYAVYAYIIILGIFLLAYLVAAHEPGRHLAITISAASLSVTIWSLLYEVVLSVKALFFPALQLPYPFHDYITGVNNFRISIFLITGIFALIVVGRAWSRKGLPKSLRDAGIFRKLGWHSRTVLRYMAIVARIVVKRVMHFSIKYFLFVLIPFIIAISLCIALASEAHFVTGYLTLSNADYCIPVLISAVFTTCIFVGFEYYAVAVAFTPDTGVRLPLFKSSLARAFFGGVNADAQRLVIYICLIIPATTIALSIGSHIWGLESATPGYGWWSLILLLMPITAALNDWRETSLQTGQMVRNQRPEGQESATLESSVLESTPTSQEVSEWNASPAQQHETIEIPKIGSNTETKEAILVERPVEKAAESHKESGSQNPVGEHDQQVVNLSSATNQHQPGVLKYTGPPRIVGRETSKRETKVVSGVPFWLVGLFVMALVVIGGISVWYMNKPSEPRIASIVSDQGYGLQKSYYLHQDFVVDDPGAVVVGNIVATSKDDQPIAGVRTLVLDEASYKVYEESQHTGNVQFDKSSGADGQVAIHAPLSPGKHYLIISNDSSQDSKITMKIDLVYSKEGE